MPLLETRMKADEKKLEQNDLIRWITTFWTKLKTGQLIGPKTLGVILLLLLVGGLWYFLSGSGAKEDSKNWSLLEAAQSNQDYKALIDAKGNANVVLVSRITLARIKLREGISELSMKHTRMDGIGKVEKAREELQAITKDLEKSKDRVLRTECLYLTSQAELALVGISKDGVTGFDRDNPEKHRGTIVKAVELLNEAAKTIGETSEAGELLKKRAKELSDDDARELKDKDFSPTATQLGVYLNKLLYVEPTPQITPIAPDPITIPKINDHTPTTNRTPTTGR